MNFIPNLSRNYIMSDKNEYKPSERIDWGFIALLGFIAGTFINPVFIFRTGSIALYRPQLILGVAALIGLLFGLISRSRTLNWTSIQTSYSIYILTALLSLLNLASNTDTSSSVDKISTLLKTWLMLVLIGAYAGNSRLFKICFNFFIFVVVLVQIHSLKAIIAGVNYTEGRFDIFLGQVSNPDYVGCFFAFMIPVLLEIYLQREKLLSKMLFLGSALASLFLLVKTQTRGAFLALLVVLVLWVIKKNKRYERIKISFITIICLVIFGTLTAGPGGTFFDRMSTIFIRETRERDANVVTRLELWKQGIRIWRKFPVLGAGVGGMDPHEDMDGDYTGGVGLTKRSLHQSFIQVLAEQGAVGGLAFLVFLFSIFRSLSRTKKWCKEKGANDILSIANGLQLGMIGLLISAFFISIQNAWVLIFFSGFTVSTYTISSVRG